MHMTATSQLTGVSVEEPKEIFPRYRRLGVYRWDDVNEIAKRLLG